MDLNKTPAGCGLQFLQAFIFNDLSKMRSLLTADFNFIGPLYEFHSADEYLQSLKHDPPQDMTYQIIAKTEQQNISTIIYELVKKNRSIICSQTFWVKEGKITKSLLVFDTRLLSN